MGLFGDEGGWIPKPHGPVGGSGSGGSNWGPKLFLFLLLIAGLVVLLCGFLPAGK